MLSQFGLADATAPLCPIWAFAKAKDIGLGSQKWLRERRIFGLLMNIVQNWTRQLRKLFPQTATHQRYWGYSHCGRSK